MHLSVRHCINHHVYAIKSGIVLSDEMVSSLNIIILLVIRFPATEYLCISLSNEDERIADTLTSIVEEALSDPFYRQCRVGETGSYLEVENSTTEHCSHEDEPVPWDYKRRVIAYCKSEKKMLLSQQCNPNSDKSPPEDPMGTISCCREKMSEVSKYVLHTFQDTFASKLCIHDIDLRYVGIVSCK